MDVGEDSGMVQAELDTYGIELLSTSCYLSRIGIPLSYQNAFILQQKKPPH